MIVISSAPIESRPINPNFAGTIHEALAHEDHTISHFNAFQHVHAHVQSCNSINEILPTLSIYIYIYIRIIPAGACPLNVPPM